MSLIIFMFTVIVPQSNFRMMLKLVWFVETLPGCQVPTNASLSPPSAMQQIYELR